jgi:hypothetical protein
MRDRNLEKNIQRIEAFVDRWKQLSVFLDRGFQGQDFKPEEEAAFLELKSQIAQEHEVVMTTLGSAVDRDDKALRLLNTVPSLEAFKELPEGMGKKIATEWHNTFISFQALLGRLKGRQTQLAAVSTFRYALRRVFGNPLVIILVAAAAFYGVYRFADEWIPKLKELMEKKQ